MELLYSMSTIKDKGLKRMCLSRKAEAEEINGAEDWSIKGIARGLGVCSSKQAEDGAILFNAKDSGLKRCNGRLLHNS